MMLGRTRESSTVERSVLTSIASHWPCSQTVVFARPLGRTISSQASKDYLNFCSALHGVSALRAIGIPPSWGSESSVCQKVEGLLRVFIDTHTINIKKFLLTKIPYLYGAVPAEKCPSASGPTLTHTKKTATTNQGLACGVTLQM